MDGMQEPGQAAMSEVRPGMKVVDSTGKEVGTVELVKMGDPQAVTSQGQMAGTDRGLVQAVAEVFADAEPDVPPALAERLLRTGFVKVDARGLFARDFYVGPDQVAGVDGETLHLTGEAEGLAKET
ncbi:hypothetical protein [Nonomuraea sp. SYSU D8015]|uniref:hypothetical protein n=1 Tax=Nonomuraea sp. SYSU D8015 TaxID=2593644 RepID=UPI0016604243|nr:hypothetical protein [Nonomuraea sp. SYSU D8015]